MCKVKTPKIPKAPPPRAMERLPDRSTLSNKARRTYRDSRSSTSPGATRARAPAAILGATSIGGTPGVVLGSAG